MRKRGSTQDGKILCRNCIEWLDEMKKRDEEEKMEEMHQHKVAQMRKSAEGSAGLLQKITAKTGVGCDGLYPKVHLDLTRSNKSRHRGISGEDGAEWQMAAKSLYDDVLLDTEKCYK